jgi:peptidoglycan/LPS O-acetylase OafA/YrhL
MVKRKWLFWTGLVLIVLAFATGIFCLLTLVLAVEVPKAVAATVITLLCVWAVSSREKEAEPLVMNESVWLDVDSDK